MDALGWVALGMAVAAAVQWMWWSLVMAPVIDALHYAMHGQQEALRDLSNALTGLREDINILDGDLSDLLDQAETEETEGTVVYVNGAAHV